MAPSIADGALTDGGWLRVLRTVDGSEYWLGRVFGDTWRPWGFTSDTTVLTIVTYSRGACTQNGRVFS
jgi:hypothetical protein